MQNHERKGNETGTYTKVSLVWEFLKGSKTYFVISILAILMNWNSGITAEVILGGMISGLASTGLHEMLRNLLNFDGKSK